LHKDTASVDGERNVVTITAAQQGCCPEMLPPAAAR
jgi:hypothetical protein